MTIQGLIQALNSLVEEEKSELQDEIVITVFETLFTESKSCHITIDLSDNSVTIKPK